MKEANKFLPPKADKPDPRKDCPWKCMDDNPDCLCLKADQPANKEI